MLILQLSLWKRFKNNYSY